MWRRFLALFNGGRLDRELHDEIGAHLAMQEEEFRRSGMSPEAARQAARRAFGGVAQTMERYRERRGIPWLESAAGDVRYALRGLRRSPGFWAAAVLSLALGIGANTAVFSLFHALMLRMLPVARPSELVALRSVGGWSRGQSSYPLYLDLSRRADLFRGLAARSSTGKVRMQAGAAARAEFVGHEYVTGNYFEVLGVAPALGRLFNAADDVTPRGHPLAVVSYSLWRNRFGADPGLVGRTLLVDDRPLTVIGVAAPGFDGVEVEHRAELWEPVMMAPFDIREEGMHWLYPLGRRAPGVSRARIQAAADTIMRRHLLAHYGNYPNAAFKRKALQQRLEAFDGSAGISGLRDHFETPLAVLMAAVGVVLLVACMNVANLLLARGAARAREIALRYSLGATRARLVRQSLTESLLLAAAGCLAGLVFAFWGQRYILSYLPAEAGEPFSTAPDPAVLAFTAGVSLLSVLVFGVAPALRSVAVDPAASLQARGSLPGARGTRLRRALVVAQVAFSVVLVTMAGLFGRSLAELRAVDPGFRNRGVITFQLDFPRAWKRADASAVRGRFLARAEALPGVVSASYSFPGPYQSGTADMTVRIPGSERASREPVSVEIQYASARHFETIGSPPVLGREFDRNDTAGSRKVALVNEAFVRAYLAGADPLGGILIFNEDPVYVVGVLRDMAHYGLRQGTHPTVYVPFAQMEPDWPPVVAVRASAPAAALVPALRRELEKLGPQTVLTEPSTLSRQIDDDIFQDRLLATLSGFFGLLALALAGIGLYGVVAYGTARRAGEIGVRIALGARRGAILAMVLRDALLLVGVGLALGIPVSLAAARAVGSILFAVKPADPATFLAAACVLAGVGIAAAFLPARRAASLDPLKVLRHE